MKTKLYFRHKDDEHCFNKEFHFEKGKLNGQQTVVLYEAVPEKLDGVFFCRATEVVGEDDGGCGKLCEFYDPRNGKSGMCRHKDKTTYSPGKEVTFKVK